MSLFLISFLLQVIQADLNYTVSASGNDDDTCLTGNAETACSTLGHILTHPLPTDDNITISLDESTHTMDCFEITSLEQISILGSANDTESTLTSLETTGILLSFIGNGTASLKWLSVSDLQTQAFSFSIANVIISEMIFQTCTLLDMPLLSHETFCHYSMSSEVRVFCFEIEPHGWSRRHGIVLDSDKLEPRPGKRLWNFGSDGSRSTIFTDVSIEWPQTQGELFQLGEGTDLSISECSFTHGPAPLLSLTDTGDEIPAVNISNTNFTIQQTARTKNWLSINRDVEITLDTLSIKDCGLPSPSLISLSHITSPHLITNCNFSDSAGNSDGGCLFLSSELSISDSTFTRCSALRGGGVWTNSDLNLTNCHFQYCSGIEGIAVFVDNSGTDSTELILENSKFRHCAAQTDRNSLAPLSVVMSLHSVKATTVEFTNCSSFGTTAMVVDDSTNRASDSVTLTNVVFASSTIASMTDGTSLVVRNMSKVSLNNVNFTLINSNETNAAFSISNVNKLDLQTVRVENQHTTGSSLVSIEMASNGNANFKDFNISNSYCSDTSLSIVQTKGVVLFDKCSFNNVESSSGVGGMSVGGIDGNVTIKNSNFVDLSGKNGAAAFFIPSSSSIVALSITGGSFTQSSSVTENTATCVHLQNLNFTTLVGESAEKPLIFSGINAPGAEGGALKIEKCTNITLAFILFKECQAAKGAGLFILNSHGNPEENIKHCRFESCSATGDGGGIFLSTTTVVFMSGIKTANTSFVNCTSGGSGGGVCVSFTEAQIDAQQTLPYTEFKTCNFSSCSAKEGGGVKVSFGSTDRLIDVGFVSCLFEKNTASLVGGAISVQTLSEQTNLQSASIEASQFVENKCEGSLQIGESASVYDRLCGSAVIAHGAPSKKTVRTQNSGDMFVSILNSKVTGNKNASVVVRHSSMSMIAVSFEDNTHTLADGEFGVVGGCEESTGKFTFGASDSYQDGFMCDLSCAEKIVNDTNLFCRMTFPKIVSKSIEATLQTPDFVIPSFDLQVVDFIPIDIQILFTDTKFNPLNILYRTRSNTHTPSSLSPQRLSFTTSHTHRFINSDKYKLANATFIRGNPATLKIDSVALSSVFKQELKELDVYISGDGGTTWGTDPAVINVLQSGRMSKGAMVTVIVVGVVLTLIVVGVIVFICLLYRRSQTKKQDGWKKMDHAMELQPNPKAPLTAYPHDFDF
ncbi:hypothetical protein BLNAU_4117 [Blattamonas nauphoetae]|uniref:Right handed beta helix domain-containing protein n=1 Tax=Blattamonas nauphoetae TaxID=2049346 RepID=A0ABQ9YB93_9EUKA|nr:hypothetical protein BLNAU_4117 [Blattamonas nauphoetae]